MIRRRFQFSIRSVFLLTFLVSFVYGWHAWQQAKFRKKFARLTALNQLGGSVDSRAVPENESLPGKPGIDDSRWIFIRLHMEGSKLTDDDMPLIEPLDTLEMVDLRNTNVTDAGLMYLRGLRRLTRLELRGTRVTEAGVQELQGYLPDCEINR